MSSRPTCRQTRRQLCRGPDPARRAPARHGFVWSRLTQGDPYFTLSQVALNDAIMIVAFAPIVALLLGLSAIVVPWDTLFVSVLLYIVIPVVIAQVWRMLLLRGGEARLQATLARIQPYSTAALLATIVLLFAFQGRQILAQPLIIAMLAIPIVIQVYFNSGFAYLLNRRFGVAHCWPGPGADRTRAISSSWPWPRRSTLFGFNSVPRWRRWSGCWSKCGHALGGDHRQPLAGLV